MIYNLRLQSLNLILSEYLKSKSHPIKPMRPDKDVLSYELFDLKAYISSSEKVLINAATVRLDSYSLKSHSIYFFRCNTEWHRHDKE